MPTCFLRVARTEFEMGAVPRAAELVIKAVGAHDSIVRHLKNTPLRFAGQKRGLEDSVHELSDAIALMEQQLHHRPGTTSQRT